MTRYVIERVLYRLSVSPYRERFVLKGAMLFRLWTRALYRSTGDLDLLGVGENAPAAIADVFARILALPVEDDGIAFRPETLRARRTNIPGLSSTSWRTSLALASPSRSISALAT